MPFNYKPLFKRLIDKGMTREELRKRVCAGPSSFARIGKNENVSMDLLDRICTELTAPIEEVIEHETPKVSDDSLSGRDEADSGHRRG